MPVEPLHAKAESNLRFIREKMEHASRFTGVPGWGGMLMGAVAIVTASVAATRPDPQGWLVVWLVAAMVATLIGGCCRTGPAHIRAIREAMRRPPRPAGP